MIFVGTLDNTNAEMKIKDIEVRADERVSRLEREVAERKGSRVSVEDTVGEVEDQVRTE